MYHIDFDWFTPRYAFRQTPEDVRVWVEEAGLTLEHIHVEEAGRRGAPLMRPNNG